MSDAAAAEKNTRPKRSNRQRPVKNANTEKAVEAPVAASVAETPAVERPPRRENTPIPDSLLGSQQTGTVALTVRNRKFNFGFIALAVGEKVEDPATPRAYFNPSLVSEEGLRLHRGYEVTFTVDKDEKGRSVAKDIALTENGKKKKEEGDAAAAEKRAARAAEAAAKAPVAEAAPAAATEGDSGKKKKRRKSGSAKKEAAPAEAPVAAAPAAEKKKKPVGRSVEYTVRVEGDSSKSGTITVSASDSIGRLKAAALKAVDGPTDLALYVVTAENANGVFATRAVLRAAGDKATILLAPLREGDSIKKN